MKNPGEAYFKAIDEFPLASESRRIFRSYFLGTLMGLSEEETINEAVRMTKELLAEAKETL